jgi:hypothetical protein
MVSLRLDDDLQAKLDALGGQRSVHLKAAIEAYVASGGKPVVPKPYVAPKVPSVHQWSLEHPRWGEDNAAILGALETPKSARSLVAVLGWQEMRVDRALQRLMEGKMLVCEGGLFRRVE